MARRGAGPRGSLHHHGQRRRQPALARPSHRLEDFEPLSADRFVAGALQPVAWYLHAQRFRRIYRDRVNELFKHWDILLAPGAFQVLIRAKCKSLTSLSCGVEIQ